MAKLTPEQQKTLDELLARQEEPDETDDNYEVTIEIEGKAIRIPYKKAKPWLKKQGIDLDDILEEVEGEGGEEEEEEEEELPPELQEQTPRPKATRRAPKKAAPPRVSAVKPEAEPPVETRGRSYWKRAV